MKVTNIERQMRIDKALMKWMEPLTLYQQGGKNIDQNF